MFLKCLTNSTVLLKVDYNIAEGLNSLDRIDTTIPTIKLLLENNNKIVLITHWGRPVTGDDTYSTQKLVKIINNVLQKNNITKTCHYVNQFESFSTAREVIDNSDDSMFILENTRFHKYEKSSSNLERGSLARNYAILGDCYVDEAFSLSHRQEVTNYDLKKIFDLSGQSAYGLLYELEVQNLHKIKELPDHPFVVIMGGAKLETKLSLIEKVLHKADKIIIGGLLAFTFLEAKRLLNQEIPEMHNSSVFIEKDYLNIAKNLLESHYEKLILPIDFIYGEDKGGKYSYDIGPESIKLFESILDTAKTIFWNGPLGYYEKEPYDQGTCKIAHYITTLHAFTAIGGGDVVSAIPENDKEKINFVSMGGGASLDFLSK